MNQKIKILIATPLSPPDIGGPAMYSIFLKEALAKRSIVAEVVSFSDVRRYPSGIRHVVYLYHVLRKADGAECILALDAFSVGFPATVAAMLLRKKIIIRLGGDFLWEQAVEGRRFYGTLRAFYRDKHIEQSPFLLRRIIHFVVSRAHLIVFSTTFQKDIYEEYYHLPSSQIAIIENALPKVVRRKAGETSHEVPFIFYAGRLVVLKNLEMLISVFADPIFDKISLVLAGRGPEKSRLSNLITKLKLKNRVKMIEVHSSTEVSRYIDESLFCVLPSLSDVSPNFALECIAHKKAIVLTAETGLRDYLPPLTYFNPSSPEDLKEKMKLMLDDDCRANYEKDMGLLPARGWDAVAEDFISQFRKTGLSL